MALCDVEFIRLNRTNQQLQQFLEAGPRRALKLAAQCLAKRSRRPLPPQDTAQRLLTSEKQDAQQLKTSLEHRHAANITLLKQIAQTQQALAKLISQEKRATLLHDEAHSGAVKHYQRPQGLPPPPVGMAQELIQAGRMAHTATHDQVKASHESLSTLHSQVTAALQAAITETTKTKVSQRTWLQVRV
jgi:hypothetical protein